MRISVCIATYNGGEYIDEQLVSILGQLTRDDEVVISDNCSTDSTLEIIRSLQDSRIKILSFADQNLVANFENALNKATGDIIFLADQDDVWLPGRVQRMKDELTCYDLVVVNCAVVDANLDILHPSLFDVLHPGVGLIRNLVKNSYVGCCMAFNRKVLSKALPFPDKLPMHDWWIGLVGELVGRVKFIDDKYALYRRHGHNASSTAGKSRYGVEKKLRMRMNLIMNIWRRFK